MISSRNLHKYQRILENSFSLSKDDKELFAGLRSAATHLYGSIGANFLSENKCSSRDISVWHEYEYKGHKIWWHTSWTHNYFTTKPPYDETSLWDWRTEHTFMEELRKDVDLKKNLMPKLVIFKAKIHGKVESWSFNAAECALLGVEPCLQKVEVQSSK